VKDIRTDFTVSYIPWPRGADSLSIKVMRYPISKTGARVFWQLDDIAAIVGFSDKGRALLRRDLGRTWIRVLGEFGVPTSDYIFAHGSKPLKEKQAKTGEEKESSAEDITMGDTEMPAGPPNSDAKKAV
jgi:hypothetical protein